MSELDSPTYIDPDVAATMRLVMEEYMPDRSKKPAPGPTLTNEQIAAGRDRLFETGSQFKKTFRNELVGIDDVLDEIDEVIHWLRHSDEYLEYNGRLEPGIIFAGSPGTGKTSTARYIATISEAFLVNVRDFPHKDPLYTDADIRDLFERARAKYEQTHKPVILLWDEFEGVAAERGDSTTTPAQKAIVTQLTVELEGPLGKNQGILLVGITNYLSSIDRALRRRGRMGKQYEFSAPDREGKKGILAHYLGQMKTDHIDVDTLSHFFEKSATAADIEEACVEAWRNAIYRSLTNEIDRPVLKQEDLVRYFIKQLVGPPTTYTVPKDERRRIAIHEIGHAVVALAYGVSVRLITVQPGKKSLGRTMMEEMAEYIGTHEEVVDFIRTGVGGMAAEKAAGLPLMVGSSGDISQINLQASRLIDRLNYSQYVGLFNVGEFGDARRSGYSSPHPSVSENAIARSDAEIYRLVKRVESEAHAVMQRIGRKDLWEMADVLNEQVTMTGKEFVALFESITGFAPTFFKVQPSV